MLVTVCFSDEGPRLDPAVKLERGALRLERGATYRGAPGGATMEPERVDWPAVNEGRLDWPAVKEGRPNAGFSAQAWWLLSS